MNLIQVVDMGGNGRDLSPQEHDIIKAIEFQEQTAQQLIDLLDVLGMNRLKKSFFAWYELSKPLKHKEYLQDIDYIMQDIKKSGAIEENYKAQVKTHRDTVAFLRTQTMKQDELVSIEQPISLIDNVERILRSLNRSIIAYLDAINGTYLGFHIDQVIDTYGDLVYSIKWANEKELIRFFDLIKDEVQVSIITTLATKTTDIEIWTLQESNEIESILPMIKGAITSYLTQGFKQKFDHQTKKQVIENIAFFSPVLIEKYPLAKNTKYLYSTASSIENAISENLSHILEDAANNVISKALSLGELNKNVFLGNIIFLLTYGFSLQGQQAYTDYIVAYLKAKKSELMEAEQRTKEEYGKTRQQQVRKEKMNVPTEVVAVKVEKPLVAIEQADLLHTVISQLCLDNADSEDEIFIYIQRMISSQKDIRLSAWMKNRNIFVDTKETWEDFIVMIKNIQQIAHYWVDEECDPIRTKENNTWKSKQKFDPKIEAKKDILVDKLEEQYKTKKALDLMAELGIEIPDAQMKKLEDKFRSLQPHYQNALKRVLHEAKAHPQLIHDKRKYRVLKFGRKYRLVLEKDMKIKDYGIYVYGEDYNKLWPDMVHNKP